MASGAGWNSDRDPRVREEPPNRAIDRNAQPPLGTRRASRAGARSLQTLCRRLMQPRNLAPVQECRDVMEMRL